MRPDSETNDDRRTMDTNGHTIENGHGKLGTINHHDVKQQNGSRPDEKIVLPNEMASMVPLQVLIGKMIRKAHADLMTLTDTLPSRSDTEKKRHILNYATLVRKQIIKLQVLVKWADDADDIQMCQNIMAFLANQNQIFRDTTHFLHKIHAELPKARIRNFDILSAVDVLTTGTYQRMPTKFQSIPIPLTDSEVLETFSKMNDVIRMRMMTNEVLPSPMKAYEIESGRIKFLIPNEFDVSLTLMGPPNERRWWIVSLNVLVKSTAGSGAADVDISLNEAQLQNLKMNSQKQLLPPPIPVTSTPDTPIAPIHFPLVNLYDYLHLFCLNMQLEIIYMQATMVSRTRWLDQLKVFMDSTRTKLTLVYWKGGSPAAHWARPQTDEKEKSAEAQANSTTIEISISNEVDKRRGPFTPQVNMAISIRDELKGLIEQAGLGASVQLSKMDNADRPKIISALKYPKNQLDVLWGGESNLHTNSDLLNPSDINVERVLWHVTRHHSLCIIEKLRIVLKGQESFLNENGLHLVEGRLEDVISDLETNATEGLKDQFYIGDMKMDISPVIVRYRHHRYITINLDMRSGRIKVREAGYRLGEGDVKLKELEERLNSDPSNVAKHLLWLRSEVVIREIVSLAKQLSLQPFHTSQMSLRADDLVKLFGDVMPPPPPRDPADTTHPPVNRLQYPSHCVFLQFAQFKDWYLVIAIVQNEVYSWLCCINEKRDQAGLFQVVVDMMHVDYEEMWREQFMPHVDDGADGQTKKRRSYSEENKENESQQDTENFHKKRRKTLTGRADTSEPSDAAQNMDNLSIDLRFMAKLDSLSRSLPTARWSSSFFWVQSPTHPGHYSSRFLPLNPKF
ncbi:mediator complex subunit MED14-domain-containing protein [Fennellomyces sp. T-0311]|nr:mediator complex subunit MED14-domain-containing protein [Fennellomyces sp. T-0311]